MMEHNNNHITDLDLRSNMLIGNEGAILLASSLGNNALAHLTRLSLSQCGIGDDGFVALMSALEENTSLLQLDLRDNYDVRAFLALADSLPNIKILQRIDLTWSTHFALTIPSLVTGLRKKTSLFRIHMAGCKSSSVPPPPRETMAIFASGGMQEVERLGYRNRFVPLIRASKETLPPLGVWSHALARVATLLDVMFEVLRLKPKLVPSEDTEGKEEAAEDTGVPKKRKRGDELGVV
jgi:hypothetical protein